MFNIPLEPKTWYRLISSDGKLYEEDTYIYNIDGISVGKKIPYIQDLKYQGIGHLNYDYNIIENVNEDFNLADYNEIGDFFEGYIFINDLSLYDDLVRNLIESRDISNYLIAYEIINK